MCQDPFCKDRKPDRKIVGYILRITNGDGSRRVEVIGFDWDALTSLVQNHIRYGYAEKAEIEVVFEGEP